MATFTRIQSNLTAADARNVGRGTSFAEATFFLDGKAPQRIQMAVEPVMGEDMDPGQGRPTARLGSLLDLPEIAQDVRDHEKAALLARKRAGAIRSAIRDRPNGPGGEHWEWDHWAFTLSREETAWLAANPGRKAEAWGIIAEGMRAHPTQSGTRMALVTDWHTDTGAWHVQGLVSRYAMDYGTQPPTASTAVDLSNNSTAAELVAQMQARFDAAGIPFNVSRAFINEARSKLEDRGTTDAAKEAYRAEVEAAGGEPGARSTIGAQPEAPATLRAIANLSPEVGKLELGARMAEDEGLKAAQRVEALRRELEAAEAVRKEAAERRAYFDQAIAAIGQRDAALEAQREAEARAEAAEAARAEREAELAATREQVGKLENEAVRAAEALSQAEDRADVAERLAGQRFAQVEELTEKVGKLEAYASEEPDRTAAAVAEAVQPIAAERDAARAEAERLAAELAEERRTFVERAKAWAEENMLAPIRRELEETRATVARQAQEIAAFPVRMAEAIRDAEARMEARIGEMVRAAVEATRATLAAPFQAAGEAIRPKTEAERDARAEAEWAAIVREGKPWDALSRSAQRIALARYTEEVRLALAGDDANARIPESARELYETAAGMAQEARQEAAGQPQSARGRATTPQAPEAPQATSRGRRAGADFLSVPPLEWSPAQRAAAAEALEKKRAADPEKWQGYTVDRYGEEGHAAWQRRQAPKPKM